MAKTIKAQDNVVILDPENETMTTASDKNSGGYIPLNKKGEPIPQSKGTGRKECPECHCFVPPISKVCPNPSCGHEFIKGEKVPKGTRGPRASKEVEQTVNPKIALLKVLKSRGFSVTGTQNIFEPDSEIEYTTEKAIAPILDFIPFYNKNGKFELGLDEMLGLLKLPLSK